MMNWNIELSKEGEEKFWDSKGRGRIERGECVMVKGKEEGKNREGGRANWFSLPSLIVLLKRRREREGERHEREGS